ncbi:MAG: hypothetical protein R3C11_23385 [Planctomycetaceae bacterium]
MFDSLYTSGIRLTSVGICFLLLSSVGVAQDEVIAGGDQIEIRKGTTGTTWLKGEIVDFNGDELQFRTSVDRNVQYYATSDILQTRYQQSVEHQQGVALLAKKNYAEAEQRLETALKVEPREWVRREILALQIRVALALFDYEKAGNRFIALCKSDEKTRHFHLIPLNWRLPEEISDQTENLIIKGAVSETTARRWLQEKEPVAQLLGVSWLLFRSEDQEELQRTLLLLNRSLNDRVQNASQMQVWRTYIAEGRFTEAELNRWETRIEDLDDLDRSGPYYLLAVAYNRKLEFDHAAVRWLWLKANESPDHLLSSEAQLNAAEALVRLGLTEQSLIVYRELVEAYPESPSGKMARDRIRPPETSSSK